jgi:hypothetical protein
MDVESAWEVVVPALPQEEAEKTFHLWKQEQEKKGIKLRPTDVRRDQVLKGPGEGCLVRYLVRRSSV